MFVKTVHISFQVNSQRSALVIHIPRRWFFVSAHAAPLFYYFFLLALWLRFQQGRKTDGRNRGRAESGWSHSPAVPRLWLATQPLWSRRQDRPVPLPAGRTNKLTSGSVRTFPVRRRSCEELAVVMGEEWGQGRMLKDFFFYYWLSGRQVAQLVTMQVIRSDCLYHRTFDSVLHVVKGWLLNPVEGWQKITRRCFGKKCGRGIKNGAITHDMTHYSWQKHIKIAVFRSFSFLACRWLHWWLNLFRSVLLTATVNHLFAIWGVLTA